MRNLLPKPGLLWYVVGFFALVSPRYFSLWVPLFGSDRFWMAMNGCGDEQDISFQIKSRFWGSSRLDLVKGWSVNVCLVCWVETTRETRARQPLSSGVPAHWVSHEVSKTKTSAWKWLWLVCKKVSVVAHNFQTRQGWFQSAIHIVRHSLTQVLIKRMSAGDLNHSEPVATVFVLSIHICKYGFSVNHNEKKIDRKAKISKMVYWHFPYSFASDL